MHTREMLFPDGEIRTDSLLYREKCRLLIPEPFTQNMFLAHCDYYQTRFYVASESARNLDRMEAFFSRLYGAIFQDAGMPQMERVASVVLKNSMRNMRRREFYHPGFVRNILDYTSVDRESSMRYCVSIRSGNSVMRRPGRYNFTIGMGFSNELARRRFSDLLDYELRTLKAESGFSLKRAVRPRMGDNLLSTPFNLINFIRVPSERDIIV